MNNKSQSIRVGLFFLLGLALAWITFESLNGGRLFKKPGYTLVAGFANLKGLKGGDEIRMAGVKVGAVQLTRLAGHRVEALLAIEPGVKIPSDAVASTIASGQFGRSARDGAAQQAAAAMATRPSHRPSIDSLPT